MGIQCDDCPLDPAADAIMEGKGPNGIITIGVERKSLHDMLANIDTSYFSAQQRTAMKNAYTLNFLIVEGMWKCREDGMLMESRDGCSWFECRPNGKRVMYAKLRRYLFSISYSGMVVIFTRDLWHTAKDITEIYHYHQKDWDKHTSLLEVNKPTIPTLNHKPSVTRLWADALDGVGVKLGQEAERKFRKPIRLANSDEQDWLSLDGVGVKRARDIVRQIQGTR